ncbi:MAG: GFA family protein [Pseudaminobacter sp.]
MASGPGEKKSFKDITECDGACHCGAVRFHVRLSDGLHSARRCSCSYCRMRGAVAVTARLGDIDIRQGEEMLTLYQFNTMTAKHYFCSRCGIYTHHQRRSNPNEYGVNAACLEGVSPFDFEEVPVNDGVHHPSDHGEQAGSGLVGTLKFIQSG